MTEILKFELITTRDVFMIIRIYDRFAYREASPTHLREYLNVYDYRITPDKMTDIDYFKKNSTQLSFALIDIDSWLYDNIVNGVYNIGDFIGLVVKIFTDENNDDGDEFFTGYIKKFGSYDIKTKKVNFTCFDFTNLISKAEGYNLETNIETSTGICQVAHDKGIYYHYDSENFDFSPTKDAFKFMAHIAGFRFFNHNEVFQDWLQRAYLTNGTGGFVDDGNGYDVVNGQAAALWAENYDEDDGKCFETNVDGFTSGNLENYDRYMMLDTYFTRRLGVDNGYQDGHLSDWTLNSSWTGIFPYFNENGDTSSVDINTPVVITVWYQEDVSVFTEAVYRYDVWRLRGSTWGKILSSEGNKSFHGSVYNSMIQPIVDRFHIYMDDKTKDGQTMRAPYRQRTAHNGHLISEGVSGDTLLPLTEGTTVNSIIHYNIGTKIWEATIWNQYLDSDSNDNYIIPSYSNYNSTGDTGKRMQLVYDAGSTEVQAYIMQYGASKVGFGPHYIRYSGVFDFSSIYYSETTHSIKDLLQLLTLTNNTAIRCNKEGEILFENKDADTNGDFTIIDDNDVINARIKPISRRNINFELLEHMYTSTDSSDENTQDINQTSILIEEFYNNLFGRVHKALTCEISYEINTYPSAETFDIGDGITVYDENYKIVSITNDFKNEKYIIEAWNDSSGIGLLLEDSSGILLFEDGDSLDMELPDPPARTLQVITPNGGETVSKEDGTTIIWTSSNVGVSSTILIEQESGGIVSTIASVPNSGSYSWDTSILAERSDYEIIITLVSDSSVSDVSDAVFEIKSSVILLEDSNEIFLEDGNTILYEGV